MEKQMSFAQSEYAGKKKVTRGERFLGEMAKVVPWARLCAVLEPPYPKGERGRPPIGIGRLLRIDFLQQWSALADEALEDALYDSQAMRTFAGIDRRVEAVPDATALLKFRHLPEAHDLTRAIFAEGSGLLRERKLLMKEGTIVDATIIAAPSSTKNASKTRDPERPQVKKGSQWHFGMKAHIGAAAPSGLVHTVGGTAANGAAIAQTHELLHGQEKPVHAAAGYLGVEKREEIIAKTKALQWPVAVKRGQVKSMAEGRRKELTQALEKAKAPVRARGAHPFPIIKNLFRHRKTRCRGLAKNTAPLHRLFALANRFIARRPLLSAACSCANVKSTGISRPITVPRPRWALMTSTLQLTPRIFH